jgi:hypothetical protein
MPDANQTVWRRRLPSKPLLSPREVVEARACLTTLFQQPRKNRGRICEMLYLLIGYLAYETKLPTEAEDCDLALAPDNEELMEEAIQSTALYCIEGIARFRRRTSGNPFTYFRAMASRRLKRFLSNAQKERCTRLPSDDDLCDETVWRPPFRRKRSRKLEAPLECVRCGAPTGPLHPIDADHAGWVCPYCMEKLTC